MHNSFEFQSNFFGKFIQPDVCHPLSSINEGALTKPNSLSFNDWYRTWSSLWWLSFALLLWVLSYWFFEYHFFLIHWIQFCDFNPVCSECEFHKKIFVRNSFNFYLLLRINFKMLNTFRSCFLFSVIRENTESSSASQCSLSHSNKLSILKFHIFSGHSPICHWFVVKIKTYGKTCRSTVSKKPTSILDRNVFRHSKPSELKCLSIYLKKQNEKNIL